MKKNLSDTTKRRKRDMEENYTPNPMCTNRRVSGVRDSALPRSWICNGFGGEGWKLPTLISRSFAGIVTVAPMRVGNFWGLISHFSTNLSRKSASLPEHVSNNVSAAMLAK
jgi:hypothetical protein